MSTNARTLAWLAAAIAGLVTAGSCVLNPQPEPPMDRSAGDTGGSPGALGGAAGDYSGGAGTLAGAGAGGGFSMPDAAVAPTTADGGDAEITSDGAADAAADADAGADGSGGG